MLRSSILFSAAVAGALAGLWSKRRSRVCYFRIRRTKSELGYTFWILEGLDKHKCFVLFDTWQEAIDEANLRLRHPVRRVAPATAVESLSEHRISFSQHRVLATASR